MDNDGTVVHQWHSWRVSLWWSFRDSVRGVTTIYSDRRRTPSLWSTTTSANGGDGAHRAGGPAAAPCQANRFMQGYGRPRTILSRTIIVTVIHATEQELVRVGDRTNVQGFTKTFFFQTFTSAWGNSASNLNKFWQISTRIDWVSPMYPICSPMYIRHESFCATGVLTILQPVHWLLKGIQIS